MSKGKNQEEMMTKELTLQKKEVTCGHCRRHASEVLVCEWISSYSTHLIYFCIHCNKQIEMVTKQKQEIPPVPVNIHS